MKIDGKRKLSSRKFWAAVAGVVVSIMIIFGTDAGTQEKITGAITSTGILVTYILAEGSTDKAALNKDENSDESED